MEESEGKSKNPAMLKHKKAMQVLKTLRNVFFFTF